VLAFGGGFSSTVTELSGLFFLLINSTTDPNSAITTAKATAPRVPKPRNAGAGLACEVTEDEPDVVEVGRIMGVAVVVKRIVVLLGLTVLGRLVVLLAPPALLIIIVDAGKLSSTVALPDGTLVGPLTMKTKQ
jgi:hypothetical protein